MRYPGWRLVLFVALTALPLCWLYLAWTFALGPDPGKTLLIYQGQGALVLLLLSLAMTPLQRITGWSGWIVMRRQVGLWAFAYAVLHLLCYLFFVLGLDLSRLAIELQKRPYILVGSLALLLLVPLVVTSNRWSMRRLGARWKRLHRLVFLVLALVLLHMLWVVRSDIGQWAAYAGVGGVLVLLRWRRLQGVLGRWKHAR